MSVANVPRQSRPASNRDHRTGSAVPLGACSPAATAGSPRAVGVWAEDPLTSAALAAVVRRSTGSAPVSGAALRELTSDDVVLVAADHDGARARALLRVCAAQVVRVGRDTCHAAAPPARDAAVGAPSPDGNGWQQRLEELLRPPAPAAGRDQPAGKGGAVRDDAHRAGPAQGCRPTLSPRELEVLRLLASGRDTAEVALDLCYSPRTVKNVVQRAVRVLGARNRSQAVALAARQGLL